VLDEPRLADQFESKLQDDGTQIKEEEKISLMVHPSMQEKYPQEGALNNAQ